MELQDFSSGVVMVRSNGLVPVKLHGLAEYCSDGRKPYVRIEFIPNRERQDNRVWGEGPSLIKQEQIIRSLSDEELFDWLKAQICLDRLENDFSEIRGFSIFDGKLFVICKPIVIEKRSKLVESLLGAYKRSDVVIISGPVDDSLTPVQEAIIAGTLPKGWEVTEAPHISFLRNRSLSSVLS